MAVEVSSVCKSATHQTLISLGVFAHPAGSTNLQSSWAFKAFRIANLWRICGEASW